MVNEKRLIDANKFCCVYEFVKKHLVAGDSEFLQGYEAGLLGAYNAVNAIDTVDAVEVVHGRWAIVGKACVCSVCHNASIATYYYCPECGAKMDGGVADGNQ